MDRDAQPPRMRRRQTRTSAQKAIEGVRGTLTNKQDPAASAAHARRLKCLRMLYQLSITGFASFS